MVSKQQKILYPYNSTCTGLVIFLHMSQNRDLNKSLLYKLLWFFNDFYSQKFFCFMVINFKNLSKRSTIYRWYNFIPIGDVRAYSILVKLRCVFRLLRYRMVVSDVLCLEILLFFSLYDRIWLILLDNSLSGAVKPVFLRILELPSQKVDPLILLHFIYLTITEVVSKLFDQLFRGYRIYLISQLFVLQWNLSEIYFWSFFLPAQVILNSLFVLKLVYIKTFPFFISWGLRCFGIFWNLLPGNLFRLRFSLFALLFWLWDLLLLWIS